MAYKIKKIKYSRRMAKRMYTPHYYRIIKNGRIVGEAQTVDIAKRWVKRLKKKKE